MSALPTLVQESAQHPQLLAEDGRRDVADAADYQPLRRLFEALRTRQPRQQQSGRDSSREADTGDRVASTDGTLSSEAPTRPTESVDSYRRSTDAMRDTAKWLLTVLPVGGVIVALRAVVPALALVDAEDAKWTAIVIWLLIAMACLAVTLILAARVLTAGPAGWGDVVRTMGKDSRNGKLKHFGGPRGRRLQAEADRQGVVRLYGYRSTKDLVEGLALDDPTTARAAVAAGNTLVDFATFRVVRGRFRAFLVLGGLAAVGATLSTAAAGTIVAGMDARLAAPAKVQIAPSNRGLEALADAGCTPSDGRVEAIAVSGTWNEPVVIVNDVKDGCQPVRLDWKQHWGVVVPSL